MEALGGSAGLWCRCRTTAEPSSPRLESDEEPGAETLSFNFIRNQSRNFIRNQSRNHSSSTFSSTLQTHWHHRMRKMMMTNRRMMVTRQPMRMGVFPSSEVLLFDGAAAEET